ncbi:hypothetical protein QTP86_009051 [Hemibagrus guttatus]|nr:hypothetical protein QTP86_009051 [Hemibagrus guttatus]
MSPTTPTTKIPTTTFITTQATTTAPTTAEAILLTPTSTTKSKFAEATATEEISTATTVPYTSQTAAHTEISDTSYAVNFTFNISNVSMTQNPDLRNDTYSQVESIINNAVCKAVQNTGVQFSSELRSSGNQVNGKMTYHFQDRDTKTPAAFLNELKAQSTPITGSAMVQTRMVFSSSSPVPSESLVLSVTQTLLSARLTNLSDSVKVLNFTYEKISDTSYAVNFTFNISNVSMTQNPDLRNDTYSQVESIINNAVCKAVQNTGVQFSSELRSSGNQVNGKMTYHFQDRDTKTPAAFLNELKAQSTPITGSAMVQTRMVFSSSSPVPSESLVLSVTQTLLSARLTNLSDSVKVLNFTYEKISDTSYAVNFTFNISNVSMTQNPDLRNDTYSQVESIINNAVCKAVQNTGVQFSSELRSSGNQVNGKMTYHFQDRDTKTPAAFLNELKAQSTPITGSTMVQTRMVFSSSSPVPSESLVLSVTQTLLSARLTNLSDSVKVLNFTYEKISDTSYAVNFTFNMSNISMTQNPDLRNDTYSQVESIINNAVIRSSKTHSGVIRQRSSGNQVNGDLTYHFQDGDTKTPAAFLNELKAKSTPITGSAVVQTRMVFSSSSPVPSKSLVLNSTQTLLSARLTNLTDSVKVLNFTYEKISETSYAVIFIFNISNISISENPDLRNNTYNQVASIINNALNVLLNIPGAEPFKPHNVSFTSSKNQVNEIDNKSYIIGFGFKIGNVNISKDNQLRNETYTLIQTTINSLLNTILNVKGAPEFVFPFANYTLNGTEIVANSEYIFVEGDTKWTPSGFLFAIFNISDLSTITTPAAQTDPPVHVVLRPTVQAQNTTTGGNSAWILGIIIPCSIVIILIPCWILLCCLLCGCCAGIRRRYNRRRSYNVQYATRNRLF